MAGRSSTSHGEHGLAVTIVRWLVFAAVVLLLLLVLTPVADAAGLAAYGVWVV